MLERGLSFNAHSWHASIGQVTGGPLAYTCSDFHFLTVENRTQLTRVPLPAFSRTSSAVGSRSQLAQVYHSWSTVFLVAFEFRDSFNAAFRLPAHPFCTFWQTNSFPSGDYGLGLGAFHASCFCRWRLLGIYFLRAAAREVAFNEAIGTTSFAAAIIVIMILIVLKTVIGACGCQEQKTTANAQRFFSAFGTQVHVLELLFLR